MKKVFSLKNIALAALVIIGGAFMFASSRSDSPALTADISSSKVTDDTEPQIDQAEPRQEAEPQIDQTEPQQETEPQQASPLTQDDQPKEETTPDANTESTQKNDSEQSYALTSVAISPSSVKPGKSITITISTSGDIFSIIQIDVYLESPTALNKITGAVVNINGDGNRFGSITIPSGAEEGTWKIKTIEIRDNKELTTSYNYGTDIFTTFVVAP